MYYEKQAEGNQQEYAKTLAVVGSLSNLFSRENTPYLDYRATENIFCRSFGASNESRSDVSFDAVSDKLGIGIKTYIFRSSQFEKIAEFNRLLQTYTGLSDQDMILRISEARNERIQLAHGLYDTDEAIYHCIARRENEFVIYEVPMELVDIPNITSINRKDNNISFTDGKSEYKFNVSKSTLYKKFIPVKIATTIPVDIVEDPYALLLGLVPGGSYTSAIPKAVLPKYILPKTVAEVRETVMLPLYSSRHSDDPIVHERSGLNQWNARGRARNYDEAYIPIPSWIHTKYDGFFPPQDTNFTLLLPSKQKMSAKICQAGGKALMSNPNSDLGNWLLRDVLGLEEGELLTYDRLIDLNIDSVEIEKLSTTVFRINFKQLGTFEEFKVANEIQ